MTHAITAAELPAVLERLTMRETQERCAQHEYEILKRLGPSWLPPKD
jgi:hypothetical protein